MVSDEEIRRILSTDSDPALTLYGVGQDQINGVRKVLEAAFEFAGVWRCYSLMDGSITIWHDEDPRLDAEKYITKLLYVKRDL